MIITKSHNNHCSVGVMELCLLNLLIMIDCFLWNSYPSVLFESLSLRACDSSGDFKISKKWTQ